jgi:hypothetical protein
MDAPKTRERVLGLSLLAAGCAVLLVGCTARYVATDRGPQAYYQTGFPVHDTSRDLERVFDSVKQIHVTGYYTSYRFTREDRITEADVRQRATYRRAAERVNFHHSKSATVTIIGTTPMGLRLLSTDHAARMPDTIVVYFRDEREPPGARRATRYVESISVRTSQTNLVLELPEVVEFVVVARDSANDIALLHAELSRREHVGSARVLRLRQGEPARLVWGSFVYVLGYPRGYRMVTRGIVSDPKRGSEHGFLVDGLFNRGLSGGPVLAIRGDTGELEWVGMARAASSQTESILYPELRDVEVEGIVVPYEGRLFLEQVARIDYGITFSVPMSTIQRFLRGAGQPIAAN